MSDTIYQLIEKYSKVDLPTSTTEFEKVDIDFELYEDRCVNETFQRWGSAIGWEQATKAITGIPQTEEHKKIRSEINKILKIVNKIIVDIEKLEKLKSAVEVFDFNKKWHLVEPHLNSPHIIDLFD